HLAESDPACVFPAGGGRDVLFGAASPRSRPRSGCGNRGFRLRLQSLACGAGHAPRPCLGHRIPALVCVVLLAGAGDKELALAGGCRRDAGAERPLLLVFPVLHPLLLRLPSSVSAPFAGPLAEALATGGAGALHGRSAAAAVALADPHAGGPILPVAL